MSNREISGINVKVLNLQPAIDNATKELGEGLKKMGISKLKSNDVIGFVETKKGIFMLDSEGIVQKKPLSDTNKWPVDLYGCANAEGKSIMVAVPVAVMHICPASLADMPVSETIPLEEFVRSFGRRLEVNYNMCLTHLRKMTK